MERQDRERLHERVWGLLPWYVNGTLSQRERERVEAHLEACSRCQEEAQACRRTAEAIRSAGEAAPTPHPVQLQRVLARIDEAEAEETPKRFSRLGSRFGGWRAAPRALQGALMAQVAIILLLVGVLVWRELHPGPGDLPAPAVYRTLSDAPPARQPARRLRLMFSPDATERQVRHLVLDVRGRITDGPSALGVYTVEVPTGGDSLQAVLTRLRSEPQVMLAEPAAGEAAP